MPKTFKTLREDPPSTNVGSGNIAGTAPAGDDPPVRRGNNKILRRKKFAGCEVFEVDSDRYHNCKRMKTRYERYSKIVGNDSIGEEIREYGRANPGKSIIIQDRITGAMTYLKIGSGR